MTAHEPITVLIIDDSEEDFVAFSRYLRRAEANYVCHHAQTAEEGARLCRTLHPNAILLDYTLPDNTGLHVLNELLAEHGPMAFAVIVLTGGGSEAIAVDAMKLGAQDYLVKGQVTEPRLQHALSNALARVQLQREVELQRVALATKNQQLQDALQAQLTNETALRLALRAASMATWDWDLTTNHVTWHPDLEAMVGFAPSAFGGTLEDFFRLVHPDDQALVQDRLNEALNSDGNFEVEFRMLRVDGSVRWTSARGHYLRDAHGAATRLVGIDMDISARKQAEAELMRREREFKTLVENAPDIIARFDHEMRHLYVSPAVSRATGLPPEAFIGKTNRELGMPEDLCQTWEMHTNHVFERGETVEFEFDFLSPDGMRYFQGFLIPESTASGAVETVMSITRDITILKDADARLRFLSDASAVLAKSLDFEATLEQLALLVTRFLGDACVIDLFETPASAPRSVVTHVDSEQAQMIRDMRQKYPLRRDGSHPVMQVLRTNAAVRIPLLPQQLLEELTEDDDHQVYVQQLAPKSLIAVPLVMRGALIGVVTVYAMRVPRPYSEDDVRLVEDLASRAALALDNAQLYREAQDAIREREAFLSVASHEIKNPLTSLLGRATLLSRRLGSLEGAERLLNDAEIVIEQGRRINTLLNDLLDMTRLESGQFTIQRVPVDLAALLQRVVADVQSLSAQHGIALAGADAQLWVAGDSSRLEQVFQNVLSNAVKYSPDGGQVTVAIARNGERCSVAISDQGLGIPADALPNLFKRFYRVAHASEHRIEGSGIGLYVAKEIIASHGGSIQVSSEEGVGSTFVIDLPLLQRHPQMEIV